MSLCMADCVIVISASALIVMSLVNGFGSRTAAAYGVAAQLWTYVQMPALAIGAAVWLGAHVVAVPALGLAEPPTRRPRSQEARELLLHLVYGVVTETVRRLARRVR